MITLYNNYNKPDFNAAYADLFVKAHQLLANNDIIVEPFTGLDDYFAHIGDIVKLDPNYAMLPLDEDPFVIDANARTITVPTAFVKCAGVQNDALCEIITFTVDRYFDYVDLDNTSIMVQWKNAQNVEGTHLISLKDIDTYPGKIRFGWPLTSDVTKVPGDVIFSVRFFIRNEVATAANGAEDNSPIKYILNTLPAKINIKPSLNITDPVVKEENVADLFKDFIQNSMNPSGERPLSPFFTAPGLNLETSDALNENDELEFKAQAINADNGNISYRWLYRDSTKSENDYAIEIIPGTEENKGPQYGMYEIDDNVFGPIVIKDTEGKIIHQRVSGEKYYQLVDPDKGVDGYQIYTQTSFDEKTPDTLYERFTVLKILPASELPEGQEPSIITGEYWVEATNKVSVNTSAPVSSTHCKVFAPNPVEIVKELPEHLFLGNNSELVFSLKEDNTNPNYLFTWMREGNEGNLKEDRGDNIAKYIPTEPGYYNVNYKVDLNRTVMSGSSIRCKVTNVPVAPVITNLIQEADDEVIDIMVNEDPQYKNRGKEIKLIIKTNLDEADEFASEKLSYKWFIQPLDENDFEEIKLGHQIDGYVNNLVLDENDNPIFSNELTVYTPVAEYKSFVIKCEVTNHIYDKFRTVDSGDIKPFIITWTDDEPEEVIPDLETPSEEG